jgi:hypothetical protein
MSVEKIDIFAAKPSSPPPLPPPGVTPPEESFNRMERWKAAREIIAHEDNLTAHRVTWFLTLHGFLFAALAFGVAGLAQGANKQYHYIIHGVLLLICLTGALSPTLVEGMIKNAIRQRRAAGYWWRHYGYLPDDEWARLHPKHQFPPAKGPESDEFKYPQHDIPEDQIWGKPDWSSYYLPSALRFLWIAIGCVIVISFILCFAFKPSEGRKVSIEETTPGNTLKLEYNK